MTEEYSTNKEIEAVEAKAAALGLVVVKPEPDQLFVDIDDAEGLLTFRARIFDLQKIHYLTWTEAPSPSGEPFHYHMTVTFCGFVPDKLTRILLQALLGSDRHREFLSWSDAVAGVQYPTLFFERPR